jgi:endonuclease YncB( thermonuclease family)
MRPPVHALLLFVAASASWAAAAEVVGPAVAVDGDTLRIGETVIRLFGIDAAEGHQVCAAAGGGEWNCGGAATARLVDLLAAGPISCAGTALDDFGRLLAICTAFDGTTINATLVAEGLAWAFVRYSPLFVEEEALARSTGIGVWQAPTIPPWEYRAQRAAATIENQPGPPDSCPIKGNINREGERIYHLPGTRAYDITIIHVEDGERWFCTEADAIEAGWRAPRS